MSRFLFPLALVLVLDIYGYFAIRPLIADKSARFISTFTVLWWLVPVLVFLYFILIVSDVEPHWPKALSVPLRASLFLVYFAKFIASGFFLIDDFRRLATSIFRYFGSSYQTDFWPDRSKFLTQIGILAGALPAVVLTYGIVRNAYRYDLHEVEVPIPNLPPKLQGLRIVQISDIHSGSFFRKEPIKQGIELINAQNPDLVCFTGDLVNSQAKEVEPYIDIFSKIESKYGKYSIIGNHDYGDYVRGWGAEEKQANWDLLEKYHKDIGWDLLRNQHRIIDIDGEPLALIGVENWSSIGRFPRTGDLKLASLGTEDIATKILMSHDPTHWDAQVVNARKDIQLTLSGHTHGFQFGVEIPGFKWSPSQYLYKQWAGLYTEGEQHLYVNRGFGFLGYPGRVGILPEVTLLKLVST